MFIHIKLNDRCFLVSSLKMIISNNEVYFCTSSDTKTSPCLWINPT